MNSYSRLFSGDQTALKWVGWRRRVDKQLFFGSILVAAAVYAGVYYSEEAERSRRHASIAKDIERERWRALELGLEEPTDDGFADKYIGQTRT
ncbi:uncharacterized protein TEOVI_000177900 [Trypanosoma equiperdum]|uniref:Uncharacterized protein n=4 Tax=Trypanozoon TaxID=39700 RepID=Q382N9_TRYB2|nr:hypothetical protein, conserved [Trypanosoma brucei gambiense DAL972]XP_829354.1 hypothetical protein, conserved [Trypanosoma brucei brucei TREU927]RHW67882.1 hypothetical protein DPX39_110106600 [Trypanosoma brucei equiperdum]SCU70206.1 hypothetical protein, conserved [Trypanosoma equiperdum]EAN80242.1 hypothetical protein, conserved [Trypanosoma brucei brucei TREU927]CBH18323.1 hypothetical protein, conserved [Trypanosoma brucei gambiense DAL972]|eukprot:XP_011780587.1 hypothetical protein, conserved [Trypanosoma brucei gambiense DAL972]